MFVRARLVDLKAIFVWQIYPRRKKKKSLSILQGHQPFLYDAMSVRTLVLNFRRTCLLQSKSQSSSKQVLYNPLTLQRQLFFTGSTFDKHNALYIFASVILFVTDIAIKIFFLAFLVFSKNIFHCNKEILPTFQSMFPMVMIYVFKNLQ